MLGGGEGALADLAAVRRGRPPHLGAASVPLALDVAVRDGRIGYEESGALLRFYEEGLNGYTYLEQ